MDRSIATWDGVSFLHPVKEASINANANVFFAMKQLVTFFITFLLNPKVISGWKGPLIDFRGDGGGFCRNP